MDDVWFVIPSVECNMCYGINKIVDTQPLIFLGLQKKIKKRRRKNLPPTSIFLDPSPKKIFIPPKKKVFERPPPLPLFFLGPHPLKSNLWRGGGMRRGGR